MSNIVNNPSLQKFFLYARKSTDIEDMQVQSIEGQLDELRLLAKRENITIVEELVEKQSAKVPGRPIFNKMLEMIEEGRANGIISWHPDRLARNSVDGGRIIYLVDTEKISALKFNTFWFEPTPQGKFMLSISFSQSKYYVDSLSENTRRGLRQKARNGNFPGVAPRGYLNDTRNRTIVVNKKIAPLIVEAFEKYSYGNVRLKDISCFLATKGIITTKNKSLCLSETKKILSNSFYFGLFKWSGEVYEGRHTPIISKALFDKVQEVLASRNHQWINANVQRVPKPYVGLLKCGECGMAITGEIKNKYYKNGNMDIFKYYRCTRKSKFINCRQPFIREENLDRQLSTLIKKYSLRKDWANKMLKKLDQEKIDLAQSGHRFVIEKQEEVRKISSKLTILLDSYLDQEVDKESYLTKKSELLSQKKKLEERVGDK